MVFARSRIIGLVSDKNELTCKEVENWRIFILVGTVETFLVGIDGPIPSSTDRLLEKITSTTRSHWECLDPCQNGGAVHSWIPLLLNKPIYIMRISRLLTNQVFNQCIWETRIYLHPLLCDHAICLTGRLIAPERIEHHLLLKLLMYNKFNPGIDNWQAFEKKKYSQDRESRLELHNNMSCYVLLSRRSEIPYQIRTRKMWVNSHRWGVLNCADMKSGGFIKSI